MLSNQICKCGHHDADHQPEPDEGNERPCLRGCACDNFSSVSWIDAQVPN